MDVRRNRRQPRVVGDRVVGAGAEQLHDRAEGTLGTQQRAAAWAVERRVAEALAVFPAQNAVDQIEVAREFVDERKKVTALSLKLVSRNPHPYLLFKKECAGFELKLDPMVEHGRYLYLVVSCDEFADELVVSFAHSADARWVPAPRSYHHGALRQALIDAALDLVREGGGEAVSVREAGPGGLRAQR